MFANAQASAGASLSAGASVAVGAATSSSAAAAASSPAASPAAAATSPAAAAAAPGGFSLPLPAGAFNMISSKISAQFQNDLLPIWAAPASSAAATSPSAAASSSAATSPSAAASSSAAASPSSSAASSSTAASSSASASSSSSAASPSAAAPPSARKIELGLAKRGKWFKDEPAAAAPAGLLPSISGQGVIQGNVVLGGGILPTLTLGGAINGGNNGFGVGASATVGLFGKVLPTVSVGGGAAAGVGNNLAVAALSATVSEGGGLNGLVAPANAGVSVNGEVGLQFSNGVHGLVGGNGGVWGTAGYGGFFIPSSTAMANFGGNFEFLFNNQGAAAPTPST